MMKAVIVPLLAGLLYPSESDQPVGFFSREWPQGKPVQPGEVPALLGLPERIVVTEREPSAFWDRVTAAQPWHDARERERTRLFTEVKDVLESQLTTIRYFEAGKDEITLLLIGLSDGQVVGIQTKAVRT